MLRVAVSGDINGNGFVDAGSEYDAANSLRHLLSIAAGRSVTFTTTTTTFGTRPDSIAAPTTGSIAGQVATDTNSNGTIDPGEAVPGVTVFVDTDGDSLLDNNERRTITDSNGRYTFVGINTVLNTTLQVVVQNPPSFTPLPSEIGVTRSAITTGMLSHGIAAVNVDSDSDTDLLVVNDLGNDVTVLLNNGSGNFTSAAPIQLGKRPQAISVWQPSNSSLPPVIAVAAIGTAENKGSIYVIENGLRSAPREYPQATVLSRLPSAILMAMARPTLSLQPFARAPSSGVSVAKQVNEYSQPHAAHGLSRQAL